MAAIIQINSGTGGVSNDNLPLDTIVTLTSVDTALHSYTWAIVSQPEGPLAASFSSRPGVATPRWGWATFACRSIASGWR